MSAPAAVASVPADRLLDDYAVHSGGLGLSDDAVKLRLRLASKLLATHPNLDMWAARPLDARLADLRRIKAWPLIGWAMLTGRLQADVELLVAKRLGGLARTAKALPPDGFAAVQAAAKRLGWGPRWIEGVLGQALPLALALRAGPPEQLTDADLDELAAAIEACPSASAAARTSYRRLIDRLRQVLYEAKVIRRPARRTRRDAGGLAGYLDAVAASEIRRVMAAYLQARAAVLRPGTIAGLANDLACFGQFLSDHYPQVSSLRLLERSHVEAFCAWSGTRPRRGRHHREGMQVSASAAAHTVISLRSFLDDIAAWGWAERPSQRLVFACDIPRQPRSLPRALAPDVDAAVMAAVARLDDRFCRVGLTVLRATGLRIGELVDLEVDCVIDYPGNGSWLRVPLGKLGTERAVPLDETALAALDEWTAHRGPQRALPHPRDGRMADFLFVEHGRRLPPARLRRGLADTVRATGLTSADGAPLRVTPHQLRHTYATALVNAGMSLQALMALLGHRSPEMTLRYASLASPTLRDAYEQAMSKMRQRLPLVPASRPAAPDHLEWLRREMLKTRLAHGYCSRDLVAQACPYANICENCANFVTTVEFVPVLENQLADVCALRDDAQARGWDSEAARHSEVIASIQNHLQRLKKPSKTNPTT
jgi:site-specific recombinase XerD